MTYEQEVWMGAIRKAEDDVMRFCPTLVGGKLDGETVERYAARGVVALNEQLSRLKTAREKYAEVRAK